MADINWIFKRIFDEIKQELYLLRLDGTIVYANREASSGLGSAPAEIVKKNFQDIDPEAFILLNKYPGQVNKHDLPAYKTEHVTLDGRRIQKEISTHFIANEDEEYILVIGKDISRQKSLKNKLDASEGKYRRLVENLKDEYFFYSHDTNGVFTYISPSITNILGYSREEFLAHYSEYLTDSPINEKVVRHTDLSIQGIKQPSYEVEIFHKNGQIKRLEVTEVPVFNTDDEVTAVEGIAHDVTECNKLAEDMALRTLELEEVNAALKVLLKQSSEAKKEVEEKFLTNIKNLVLPHLDDLEIMLPDRQKKAHIAIIKSNIEQITSPFLHDLSSKLPSLTPRELQVADLVRNGRTNKEIAELLHLSKRTIEFYRERLRQKLQIKNRKINLRSYLLNRM